jgi:hypothetical protein
MKKNNHCSWVISAVLVIGFVFVLAQGAFAQSAGFEIKDGVLVSYRGNAAAVVVPKGITNSKTVELTVPTLPSALRLPSWAREGMTRWQVRNRMARVPYLDNDNMIAYSESGFVSVFCFSESGGLISYAVKGVANLNTVLNSFRRTLGREPNGISGDTVSWLLPSEIREDLFWLQVHDSKDGYVFVFYTFTLDAFWN